jgi:mercuric ion transport protein
MAMNDADHIRTNAADVVGADIDRSFKPESTGGGKRGRALIGAGLVGAGLAALCCATPLLAVLLPTVGLGAWLAGADWILLVLLFVSVGILALGLLRRRARTDACCETQITKKKI